MYQSGKQMCIVFGKTTIWHLVSVERIEGAGHFVHDKGRGENPPKQYAKGGTDFG